MTIDRVATMCGLLALPLVLGLARAQPPVSGWGSRNPALEQEGMHLWEETQKQRLEEQRRLGMPSDLAFLGIASAYDRPPAAATMTRLRNSLLAAHARGDKTYTLDVYWQWWLPDALASESGRESLTTFETISVPADIRAVATVLSEKANALALRRLRIQGTIEKWAEVEALLALSAKADPAGKRLDARLAGLAEVVIELPWGNALVVPHKSQLVLANWEG